MYEVTIFEAEDDDSFDEDTEITEAVRLKHKTWMEQTHTSHHSGLILHFPLRTTGGVWSVKSWTPLCPEIVCAAGLCVRIGCLKCQWTRLLPALKPCPRSQTANQLPKKSQVLFSHIESSSCVKWVCEEERHGKSSKTWGVCVSNPTTLFNGGKKHEEYNVAKEHYVWSVKHFFSLEHHSCSWVCASAVIMVTGGGKSIRNVQDNLK